MKPNEFKLNDYITLKLVGDQTNVYVNGERFMLCKRLVLNIPIEEEYSHIFPHNFIFFLYFFKIQVSNSYMTFSSIF